MVPLAAFPHRWKRFTTWASCHGALRPCNVMVLEDGRIKLMDLELTGLRDAQTIEGLLASEPPAEYLSPEQIRRAPATEKTDSC